MTTVKQALESAIECLEAGSDRGLDPLGDAFKAVDQCKSALVELEKCEPVATLNSSFGSDTGWEYLVRLNHNLETDEYLESIHGHDIPLFTAPQPKPHQGAKEMARRKKKSEGSK